MLGLRWMCMHLWMNLIKRTIDIQEKLKMLKIYVQSQWRVVLLWYHIFWQSSIQRGRHTQLCIITSLNWIIQICSNFYVGLVKLLSTHPIHIVVWGNFPFKRCGPMASFSIPLVPFSYLRPRGTYSWVSPDLVHFEQQVWNSWFFFNQELLRTKSRSMWSTRSTSRSGLQVE